MNPSPNAPSDARPGDPNARRFLRWLQTVMSSWFGSLVVHVVLISLLVLLAPTTGRDRSAPGERVTDNVGIVFAPPTSHVASQNFALQTPESSTQSSVADIVSQHIAELVPQREVPDIPVVGTMQNAESTDGNGAGSNSATAVAETGGIVTGSFMGAKGTGRNFVYVLDRSATTGYGNRRSPLYVAKNELLASLQSIGEASLRESKPIRFQVIFFNNTIVVFNTVGYGGSDKSGRLLTYDQATFQKVQRFLGGIISEGGTQPEPAILQAVRMGADCVFFMTDGDTRISPAQLQRINDAAKGVQINVVEYGTGNRKRNTNLQKLAADNNGNYVFVDLSKLPR